MSYEITAPNTWKYARIVQDGPGKFLVSINHGRGFDEVTLCARWFKTECGAYRFAQKKLI